MGLAKHYRFQVFNETGETLTTSDLRIIRKKLSNGQYSFESALAEVLSTGGDSVSNNGYGNGTAQNNDSDGYLGLDGEFEGNVGSGTPSGVVSLIYQVSPDGTNWPDNGEGWVVAVLEFSATGTLTTAASL